MRGIISNDAIRQHVTNLIPMKRIGEAQEAANYIGFLLSDKASYITGNITSDRRRNVSGMSKEHFTKLTLRTQMDCTVDVPIN